MLCHKFHPLEELTPIIHRQRQEGKTISLANGGFDLIHVGHIRYLKEAKGLADLLVVAINSDKSLRGLKGENRALIDQDGRIMILSALACIDYLTVFDEPRVDQVLLKLKPDFHCKGSDYTVDTVPEKETVRSYGGEIAIVGGGKVRSTSEIIHHILML